MAEEPQAKSVIAKSRRERAHTDGDLKKRGGKGGVPGIPAAAWPQSGDPWLDMYGGYPPAMFPPYMGHMPPYMYPPMPFGGGMPGFPPMHGFPPPMMPWGHAGYPAYAGFENQVAGRRRANSGPGDPARQRVGSGKDETAGAAKELASINEDEATTVMLRNIPNKYTRSMLVALIDEQGFKGQYDFVYLPMDFRQAVNLGYAFVNLLTHDGAMQFKAAFQDFSKWSSESSKTGEVSWAIPHQGLNDNVERYRNSPVMHPSMPEEYKPLVFNDGAPVEFPKPTKVIRAPKLRPTAA